MALSQKHEGKVFVPWFSIAEWKSVYNLIYTESSRNWPKALDILKIWKVRMPLLSAGVEGSLIILEALLTDTNQLTTYQAAHVLSTSLIRFLNLCAANSDKQGTFYKAALKSDLPKWLINLRHEIAHNHNVPSLSMLELSINFCLGWLKEKYWDVQEACMTDFIISKEEDEVVEDAVCIYLYLNGFETRKNGKKKKMRFCLKKYVKKNTHNSDEDIIELVFNLLKVAIRNHPQESGEKISSLVVDEDHIFPPDLEQTDAGEKRISEEFLSKMNKLLDLMHETEVLPFFVCKLLKIVYNSNCKFYESEVASLWIFEIYNCLLAKMNGQEASLEFTNDNNCLKNEKIVNEMLENPSQFTINFIKEVLQYNDAPTKFIDDSFNLLTAYNFSKNVPSNRIFTIADLNIKIDDYLCDEIPENTALLTNKWTLIEDCEKYSHLPLGVLPHQGCNINPILQLEAL